MISHGDIVWVDFGSPRGSESAKRRPAVVMQEDWLLATQIATVLIVPLTSNVALEAFPGNVLVPVDASGLGKDSVAVVSQVGPVSREFLGPYPVGHVPGYMLSKIADGIRLAMGI
ncbi:type II toxin-antitoxin system PemK/MazF family toxin [Agromyces neolithicus]|uniref:mRNA interferase n=1 Tax=Agromyces neolithicus TaxID=269420 RepID=A0ABN2LUA8_9MICO